MSYSVPSEALWKGVTSLSKAGQRRGRGKGAGKKVAKDLNKGQMIGVGRINMVWPGLNAPVFQGKQRVEQQKLPQNKDYLTEILKIRNEMDTYHKRLMHPLDRGWSGSRVVGRWIGPPDAIVDETFEDFDSKCIELRAVTKMTPQIGRDKFYVATVVTGNKKGLSGYAQVSAIDGRTALRDARNQAAQNLRAVELEDDRTIIHDWVSEVNAIKVAAYKKPAGYGLVCHRAILEMCRVTGIKDIYCKVYGNTGNYIDIVQAFYQGLCNQKNYQSMADDMGLNVVEFRKENGYYPTVKASPSNGKVRGLNEIAADEILDFRQYLNDGRIVEVRTKPYPMDFMRTEGYLKYLIRYHQVLKNRTDTRVYLKAKYGSLDSFLTVREKDERAARAKQAALEDSAGREEAN